MAGRDFNAETGGCHHFHQQLEIDLVQSGLIISNQADERRGALFDSLAREIWFNDFMGLLSEMKDRLVEQAALSYLNNKLLAPYGHATGLRIESAAKKLQLEVELKGESAPIHIEIADYEISNEDGNYFVVIKEIQTSREWLTSLARDQLVDKRWQLPAQMGQLLMRAL
jgi:hypothetical protein